MAVGSPIGKLFGASPIRPLQAHMQQATDSVRLLGELIEANLQADHPAMAPLYERLEASSLAAAALAMDLRQHLPRGLFLATPRPDLINLLAAQEQISAASRRLARQVVFRDIKLPAATAKSLSRISAKCRGTVEHALLAIEQTDELLEAGFGETQSKRIGKLLDSVERRAQQCSMQAATARSQLLRAEKNLSALDASFAYRLIDGLEDLTHATAEVGERLRLLLAH